MQKLRGGGKVRGFAAFAKRVIQRQRSRLQAASTTLMDRILRQNFGDRVEISVEPTILRH
jgi:hypothetical protein